MPSPDDPIEPLTNAADAPPVRTAEDLRRRWRSLMGPWGFGGHSLWLTWFDAADRELPELLQIEELDEFESEFVVNLMGIASIAVDAGSAETAAMLLSRPGPPQLTDLDRRRVRALVQGARHTDLPLRPVHLATPDSVRLVTLDDLGARAG